MPFITEEIWQELKSQYAFTKEETINFAAYPKAEASFKDSGETAKQMNFVIELIGSVRNTRQSLDIAWSHELSLMLNTESKFEKDSIAAAEEFLKAVTKSKEVILGKEAEQPANTTLIGETRLSIPLTGLVDFDRLRTSIINKILKIDKDVEVLGKRLDSENFVKNASAETVEASKESLNGLLEQKKLFEEELLTFS